MRLNLLPAYVKQRKINKQLIVLMALMFFLVNGALGYWLMNSQARLTELQDQKVQLESQASQLDSLVQQAQSRIAEVELTLTKVKFVDDILAWNPRYPELYAEIAQYTSPRVRYQTMQVGQGNQLQISLFTKGVREIGAYLRTMYNCPRLSAVSLTTQTQGFGGGQGQLGGGMPGGFGGGGIAPSMAGAGISAGGGGSISPSMAGAGISAGGGGGGLAGGFGGGGGGLAGGGSSQPSPAGLSNFQIVCLLREPMAAPTVPPILTGAAGGGGMPGGMPGGFGGGPPGGAPTMGAPPSGPGGPPGGGGGGRRNSGQLSEDL